MTFEPMINMADAVRQPRPKLAHSAAWLSVISANMPHQNWYVYNHIMYSRWLLEDATSSLNAELLELMPSLLGPVTVVQPTVVVVKGDAWIRARAWRDTDFEAQDPSNLCVHVVVVSVGDRPGSFKLHLDGVCRGAGCKDTATNATHLFYEAYSILAIPAPGGGLEMTDVLTPGSSVVYALGCNSFKAETTNLVNDPGFEDTELPLTPGFSTCAEERMYPKGSYKGVCKKEDKHAGSWGLSQSPERRDNRASFFVDSRLPHKGRHSGRVWVPTATPVTVPIPGYATNLYGLAVANSTAYRVVFFARCHPPGMFIGLSVGSWVTRPLVANSPLGLTSITEFTPETIGVETQYQINSTWARFEVTVPAGIRASGTTFNFRASAVALSKRWDQGDPAGNIFPAGSIWIDDVTVDHRSRVTSRMQQDPDVP